MRRFLLGLCALAACTSSEGRPPREPVKAPSTPALPLAASVKSPARWWVDHDPGVRAQYEVGGEIFSLGQGGFRALHRTSGDPMIRQGETVLPANLWAGHARSDGSWVLIDVDGRTYVVASPLGRVVEEHASPAPKIRWAAAGRASLFAISESLSAPGTLVRSADGGKTWAPVTVPYEGPAYARTVVMLPSGVGLLHAIPQQLFTTKDDGVTWTRVASPGAGVFRVEMDGKRRAILAADQATFAFDPATATFARDTYSFFQLPKFGASSLDDSTPRVVFGERSAMVVTTFENGEVFVPKVFSGPLGGPKVEKTLDLLKDYGTLAASGYGDHLAVLCAGESGTQIVESLDAGATFREVAKLSFGGRSAGMMLAGPEKWLLLTACDGGTCETRLRLAKSDVLVKAKLSEGVGGLWSSYFDETTREVWLLAATHGQQLKVFHGSIDAETLTAIAGLEIPTEGLWSNTPPAFSLVRRAGAPPIVRIFARDNEGWRSAATPSDAASKSTFDGVTGIAFHGARGLAVGNGAFESDDGGATWASVPAGGGGYAPQCAEAGCVVAGTERVGWELPAHPELPRVSAFVSAPPKPDAPEPAPKLPEVVPTLACKATGAWSKTKVSAPRAEDLDLARDVLGVSVAQAPDGRVLAQLLRANKPEVIELFGPQKTDATKRAVTRSFVDHEGVMAYRYTFAAAKTPKTGEGYGPVEVAIAWVRAANGKVRRASFPAEPFRVAITAGLPNAGTGIVESGVFLHPEATTKEAYFVGNGGKVKTFVWPLETEHSSFSGTTAHAAFATVGTSLLAVRLARGSAHLAWLDGALEATNKRWQVSEGWLGADSLSMAEGHPWIVTGAYASTERTTDAWAFPVGAPENDPPKPRVGSAASLLDGSMAVCDEEGSHAPRASLSLASPKLRPVTVEGADVPLVLGVSSASLHVTAKGACLGVVRAAGRWQNHEPWIALVSARDPKNGWLFHTTWPDGDFNQPPKTIDVKRLQCTATSGPRPKELTEK